MHQMRLQRLPPVCGSDRRRQRRHQPVPARRRAGHRAPGQLAGKKSHSAQSRQRPRTSAICRLHRRIAVYRLYPVHPGLSRRRHRRRRQADAYRSHRPVHGLRPVRGALPRRLHRDVPGQRRRHGLGRLEPEGCRRRARAPRFPHAAPAPRKRGERGAPGRQGRCQDAGSDAGSARHARRTGGKGAQARHHRRRHGARPRQGGRQRRRQDRRPFPQHAKKDA